MPAGALAGRDLGVLDEAGELRRQAEEGLRSRLSPMARRRARRSRITADRLAYEVGVITR
jgi:DNA polymerase III alpha subunit